MARRSISGGRAISPVYLELYAEERLRKIAIAQQIVLAATEVPGVAERERQEAFVARLDIGDDRLAAFNEVLGRAGRGALDVLRPDPERLQADCRQHAFVLADADQAIAPRELVDERIAVGLKNGRASGGEKVE